MEFRTVWEVALSNSSLSRTKNFWLCNLVNLDLQLQKFRHCPEFIASSSFSI